MVELTNGHAESYRRFMVQEITALDEQILALGRKRTQYAEIVSQLGPAPVEQCALELEPVPAPRPVVDVVVIKRRHHDRTPWTFDDVTSRVAAAGENGLDSKELAAMTGWKPPTASSRLGSVVKADLIVRRGNIYYAPGFVPPERAAPREP